MSSDESWLVTGIHGCIGAWVGLILAKEDKRVVGLDRSDRDHRLRLICTPEQLARIGVVNGDVADLDLLERTLDEHAITHVVHLAALQLPFCRADPVGGAHVNVVGTAAVFEAARRHGLSTSLSYASSAAVYDADGLIDGASLYGVYKIATEGIARIFWQDNKVASLGLRPFVVYGPGRDQGMTAGPTQAIAAAVAGGPYNIAFGGRTQLQYTADVAASLHRGRADTRRRCHGLQPGGPGHRDVRSRLHDRTARARRKDHFRRRASSLPAAAPRARLPDGRNPVRDRGERERRDFPAQSRGMTAVRLLGELRRAG